MLGLEIARDSAPAFDPGSAFMPASGLCPSCRRVSTDDGVVCSRCCSPSRASSARDAEPVNVGALLAAALERFGRPVAVSSDRWREGELRDALKAAGVPPASLSLRGQGFKDGAEDVRAFRRGCAEGRVTPAPSLLLAHAMSEARTISDPAMNAKLAKGTEGHRRHRARDDAAAAAILAVSAGLRRARRRSTGSGGVLFAAG